MEKKKIVVVDTDEDYITPLEYKLFAEWKDTAQIEIITSLKYFNEFFSSPQNIYMLIINEYLYSEKIRKQNCAYTFLLREEDDPSGYSDDTGSFKNLYKYSSIMEIYAKISQTIRQREVNPSGEKTVLYVTYAVTGGIGKTVMSLSLCQALSSLGKKVLYISGENFQNFHMFLDGETPLCSQRFIYNLSTKNPGLLRDCTSEIESGVFDYIRPVGQSLVSVQVCQEHYEFFLNLLKSSGMYDVIIFESSICFSSEKIRLFETADKVIMIYGQDRAAACQFRLFAGSIAFDEEKFVLICNRYRYEKEDFMQEELARLHCQAAEYIPEQAQELTVSGAAGAGFLQKTAYTLY